MKKYIAKQIDPAYQSSEFAFEFGDEARNETLAIHGNRNYTDYTFDLFDKALEYIEHETPDLTYYEDERDYIYDIFGQYLQIDHCINLTVEECREAYSIIEMPDRNTKAEVCRLLSVLTRRTWDYKTIRGCCQSDWQIIYYDTSWTDKALEELETAYFNTGSEWIIEDAEDETDSWTVYCFSWKDEDIATELKDTISADEYEFEMLEFDGYTQTPKYKPVKLDA